MTGKSRVSERVQKYRAALRAAGLRPLQIWVPDTRKRGFAAECRRQSLSLRNDAAEGETLDWLDQVADREGWES
jgi:DNA-binding LacI/PurR family transcriptional regulator